MLPASNPRSALLPVEAEPVPGIGTPSAFALGAHPIPATGLTRRACSTVLRPFGCQTGTPRGSRASTG